MYLERRGLPGGRLFCSEIHEALGEQDNDMPAPEQQAICRAHLHL